MEHHRIIHLIAALVPCDPRSVRRVLAGERVRGHLDARIRRELIAQGVEPPAVKDAA